MRKIRVFINGFGRIGRSVLRILLEDVRFEIVGINDIFPLSHYPYALRYDSVYGTLPHPVDSDGETLYIGSHKIRLFCEENPRNLQIEDLAIDLLFQCSGVFLTRESNLPYLEKGVKKVLLSAPPADDIPMYIMGYNHRDYRGERILSNSSCSANAIAPVAGEIDRHFGITHLTVSMVHSYTVGEHLLDDPRLHHEPRRARSATQNILPLQSSATGVIERLFPHLRGRCYTKSIRVPTRAATLYDFTIGVKRATDRLFLEHLFDELSRGKLRNIIAIDRAGRVSSDYIGDPKSATIDLSLCEVLEGRCIKLLAWQDNEQGYAAGLVEMAAFIARQSPAR